MVYLRLLRVDISVQANLHSFWDTTVVQALGSDPQTVAGQLRAEITPAEKAEWESELLPVSWTLA